jgi:hypothetical protein
MKTTIAKLGALSLAALISGCATPSSENRVSFNVTSDPTDCPVEVNGIHLGNTPTTLELGLSKHWVGLMYASDGWGYGNETYHITCFPPPDTTEPLTSQTKVITPSMTPKGGDLYFNLRLRQTNPITPIDITHRGKSEIIVKDERNASVAEKIRQLQGLKDEGLISQEEFDAKRKQLLEDL